MNINSLLRDCRDPDRRVGAWISSPNRASGIRHLSLFTRNPALPNYKGAGRMANPPNPTPPQTGVTPTFDSPVSFVYAMPGQESERKTPSIMIHGTPLGGGGIIPESGAPD